MTENKNIELNDEMMAKATGGWGEPEDPKYEVGGLVSLKFSNENGVVTTIIGTIISRESTPGGWFYIVRYEANGITYEHKYPEIAFNPA